jgi:hypothetical protein
VLLLGLIVTYESVCGQRWGVYGVTGAADGTCPCSEKCRGRGGRAGAEDGDTGAKRVSVHAAERQVGHAACGGWSYCGCAMQWKALC